MSILIMIDLIRSQIGLVIKSLNTIDLELIYFSLII